MPSSKECDSPRIQL